MQIVFDREALTSLRLKNPDLLSAFVCLGLSAGADGVVKMTAPGPLAHVPHKRRAGMVSALIVAGHLERTPGGYLVHGVSSEATDDGQTEDTEPTAAREASHYNTSQSNSEGTDSGQAKDSGSIPEEESEARALIELVPIEPWEELSSEADEGATDDGQTEDTEPTAAREASHCNVSQDNSEGTAAQQWQSTRDIDALESLLDGMATTETVVQVEDSEGRADAFIDITGLDEPQPAAPTMGLGIGLRRPPAAISPAPAPAADDEASVEGKAREMALEAWDLVDARTFETCQGVFDQFWTYRKRHFLVQARQELGLAES